MLVCKNCDTENPDGAKKCHQCNMGESFLIQVPNGNRKDFLIIEKSSVQCLNCGTETPGPESKCVECNFPIPKEKERKLKDSPFHPWDLSTIGTQKTG